MTTSYNGAPAFEDLRNVSPFSIPYHGTPISFPQGALDNAALRKLFTYYFTQLWDRVEPPDDAPLYRATVAGFWGAEYRQNRNANNLSCHSSGTALDNNAVRHPNGGTGSYSAAQKAEIAKIIHECGHALVTGIPGLMCTCGKRAGWSEGSTPDYMHVEAATYNPGAWAAAADTLAGPVAPPVQPTPAPPAQVDIDALLEEIMADPAARKALIDDIADAVFDRVKTKRIFRVNTWDPKNGEDAQDVSMQDALRIICTEAARAYAQASAAAKR